MPDVATTQSLADEDFAWDDLLDHIAGNKVITVLGHELLEADYGEGRVTLQRLLAGRLAQSRRLVVDPRPHFELADTVAAYLESGAHPDDPYPQVNRIARNLNPPFPLPRALEQLARIRPLEVFVSTTPDDLMAQAIDKVRHGGNALTRRIVFSSKQSTAANAVAQEAPPDGVPVVFSLFGQFSTLPEYALHEEDSLEFIHGLVSRDAAPPEWLMGRLRERVLLILGVHWPDWLERFLLRSVNSGPLRADRRTYYVARESEPSAAAIALFFQRFGRDVRLRVYSGSAIDFVDRLYARWSERVPERDGAPPPPPPARRGGIFISYDWQNRAAVDRLYTAIHELSDGDVWFDRVNLPPGSEWEREIHAQIKHGVQLFLAVLSDQTERKPNYEGVVFREWKAALDRARGVISPRVFVIPVVVDADAKQADPARYPTLLHNFPDLGNYTCGLAPGGEPDANLKRAITEQLKLLRA
jgi:hypothetical protein